MEPIIVCLVVAGFLLVPVVWFVATYNRIQGVRQHMKESWSGVDVELKRRHDLVPNLVNTVKGYAAHEREIFERIAELRSQAVSTTARGGEKSAVEGELGKVMQRLIAVAESYPELKADRNFLELQKELALTEDRIAAGRRFFNANVRELNTLATTFPSNLVAGMVGVRPETFFELDSPLERARPDVAV
jgi:LemA protein